MARPKTGVPTKQKLTLTVSPEIKEMADFIRMQKGVSISELAEAAIRKEYRKLVKAGTAPEEQIPGQQSFE